MFVGGAGDDQGELLQFVGGAGDDQALVFHVMFCVVLFDCCSFSFFIHSDSY